MRRGSPQSSVRGESHSSRTQSVSSNSATSTAFPMDLDEPNFDTLFGTEGSLGERTNELQLTTNVPIDDGGSGLRSRGSQANPHSLWVERLKSRPEFVGTPDAQRCWEAIDPTGNREPPLARAIQLPGDVTPEGAGAVLSACVRTWIPVPQPSLEERTPFSYSLLGLTYDPHETPTSEKLPEVKRAYNRVRSMLSSLMMVFEFQSLPTHDPTFSKSVTTRGGGLTAPEAFHRLSIALKLAKRLVLDDLRFRTLYSDRAGSLLSEFAAPWENYVPSATGTALLEAANEESWRDGRVSSAGRGGGRSRTVATAGAGPTTSRGNRIPTGPKGLLPHQEIIIAVLQDLKKNCLCLMDGDSEGRVWQQVLTPIGKPTRAYRARCRMIDFYRDWSAARDNMNRWKLSTSTFWTAEKIAEHLLLQHFEQFLPRRKMCRSVWAFRNGVYRGDDNVFFEYDSDNLPEDLVACKYYDQYLDPRWTTTEDLDSIAVDVALPDGDRRRKISSLQLLEEQGYSRDEAREVHAMLGRTVFPIGLYDKLDAFLAFIGQGGTGKSSIVNQLKMLFPKNYVRSFSGKEKTFGMSGCENAWLVVTTEITAELVNQIAEILQWVAGEQVPIAKKNKEQVMAKIKAHWVACGNHFALKDTAGNINRRSVTCLFDKKPQFPDTQLKVRQRREIGRFLVYSVRCYHQLLDKVGNDELIRHLQPKFRQTRREIISQINPIVSFLHRDEEVFTEAVRTRFMLRDGRPVDLSNLPYMPFELFMQLVKTHCQKYCLDARPNFDSSSLAFPMDDFGLYKLPQAQFYWWEGASGARAGFSFAGRKDNPFEGPAVVQTGQLVVGVGLRRVQEMYRNGILGVVHDGPSSSSSASTSSSSSSTS